MAANEQGHRTHASVDVIRQPAVVFTLVAAARRRVTARRLAALVARCTTKTSQTRASLVHVGLLSRTCLIGYAWRCT